MWSSKVEEVLEQIFTFLDTDRPSGELSRMTLVSTNSHELEDGVTQGNVDHEFPGESFSFKSYVLTSPSSSPTVNERLNNDLIH